MDDKLVDAANYTLQSGSTIKDDVPKTGDNAPIAGLVALMLISGTVLCTTHKKKAVRK